ncbi:MAG: ABC transporter ATP-binding protein [Lachnospiraceae bacterium]|nr:ABC transporter ATP-binding protein [Lachnospiraceae bacterium]
MELQIDRLNFSYGDRNILRDLSFTVKEGEFLSILGPSGCGKSTLLNVMAGILSPQSGSIRILNSVITSSGERMEKTEAVQGMSSHFAYMPQNDLLLPWKTILDNVCLYGEIHHCKAQMKERAREQMAIFGLSGCENKYPGELSGGMRQRAAFLRTTLCEADIYLLDEPFGALDVITRGDMQDWLRKLCSSLKKTILLVTHDTDEAIYLSDRILILGAPGEGIRRELSIPEQNRTREWLYEQGRLRAEIHRIIKEKRGGSKCA